MHSIYIFDKLCCFQHVLMVAFIVFIEALLYTEANFNLHIVVYVYHIPTHGKMSHPPLVYCLFDTQHLLAL